MARGDVAISLTLPPDVEKLLSRMAVKRGVSRRQIVTEAIKLLAGSSAKTAHRQPPNLTSKPEELVTTGEG
jgi:predicted transcriptional regulator